MEPGAGSQVRSRGGLARGHGFAGVAASRGVTGSLAWSLTPGYHRVLSVGTFRAFGLRGDTELPRNAESRGLMARNVLTFAPRTLIEGPLHFASRASPGSVSTRRARSVPDFESRLDLRVSLRLILIAKVSLVSCRSGARSVSSLPLALALAPRSGPIPRLAAEPHPHSHLPPEGGKAPPSRTDNAWRRARTSVL